MSDEMFEKLLESLEQATDHARTKSTQKGSAGDKRETQQMNVERVRER